MAEYFAELRKLVGTRPLLLPGANVILVDTAGRVLLHQRSDNGMWGLPGGFTELGETVEDTARREVSEEIGLQCGTLELLNVYSGEKYYYTYHNGDQVYNVTISYVCHDFTGEIRVNPEEGLDARFFTIGEAKEKIYPKLRSILEDYERKYRLK